MFKPLTLTLFAACLATNALALTPTKPEKPISVQDFAYAVPLQFSGQDALYQTSLPLSVYQNTVRSDLGDLRVFNGQGEVVPHMLQQAARSSLKAAEFITLPYFPLQGPRDVGLDQLSVHIKRNISGTLIDISSDAKPAASARLSGYLLDTSAIQQTMQALELDWNTQKNDFVGKVHIESSDDLKHWRTVVNNAPLASLHYGGHSLLQKRIEFPALRSKYLRLSWPQEQTALQLNSIQAALGTVHTEAPLTWLPADGSVVEDKAGEYQFDLGAHLPLQRLRIGLPQMNTLVKAALLSRAHADDAWHPVANSMLYKLHHAGQDLHSPDITVSSSHRYWLLRVDPQSGGLGAGLPSLQAGWLPHQLHFVTRGNAPFQLAYGSIEIKPAAFDIKNLLPDTENDSTLKAQLAQTGTQITLGGEARLKSAPPPLPWKKWILWAVLGISVLLLGGMAYRLVKQMEHHDSNKPKVKN